MKSADITVGGEYLFLSSPSYPTRARVRVTALKVKRETVGYAFSRTYKNDGVAVEILTPPDHPAFLHYATPDGTHAYGLRRDKDNPHTAVVTTRQISTAWTPDLVESFQHAHVQHAAHKERVESERSHTDLIAARCNEYLPTLDPNAKRLGDNTILISTGALEHLLEAL